MCVDVCIPSQEEYLYEYIYNVFIWTVTSMYVASNDTKQINKYQLPHKQWLRLASNDTEFLYTLMINV